MLFIARRAIILQQKYQPKRGHLSQAGTIKMLGLFEKAKEAISPHPTSIE